MLRISLRPQRTHNPFALLHRRGFQFAGGFQQFQNAFENPVPFFDVCQFAAAEHHRHNYLVFMLQETLGLIDLGFDIMIAGFRADPNFLDFGVVRVLLVSLFLLRVFEFAEIHDAANRRLLGRCDFDQIQIQFPCHIQGLFRAQHSQLCSVRAHNTYLRDADLLVDAVILVDGWQPPGSSW